MLMGFRTHVVSNGGTIYFPPQEAIITTSHILVDNARGLIPRNLNETPKKRRAAFLAKYREAEISFIVKAKLSS